MVLSKEHFILWVIIEFQLSRVKMGHYHHLGRGGGGFGEVSLVEVPGETAVDAGVRGVRG